MAKNEKAKKDKKPLRQRWKNYKRELQDAYNAGYQDGYDAYDKIANTKGARFMAKRGFGSGMNAHKKVVKYQQKAQSAPNPSRSPQRT